ncbi:uncharacterized protein EI97DRAFT_481753 [Westerdykella ornata]|uniref:Maintenance of telomere capping protein 6 n=1 Tax=Westerdykella ornata TaxID=318751 RepID=A0A6A6JSN1_WESOR|nr:uncharacterized protein EI97DRAFT_481753 [Westerdykella ornata]KAF2279397.1 hypothetical protein EI97DRAFT_481753 [Westerdykella ornata]
MTSTRISFTRDPKSGLYGPDPALVAEDEDKVQSVWETAFLSQRDVGLNIPINYLTVPGISLRAACFAQQKYEDTAFRRCFSNLLAAGFRRFVVDVFWDAGRGVWGLCPVEVPEVNGGGGGDAAPGGEKSVDASASIIRVGRSQDGGSVTVGPSRGSLEVWARQDVSVSSSASVTATSTEETKSGPISTFLDTTNFPAAISTSTTAVRSPDPQPSGSDETPLFHLDDYVCSATMSLGLLTSLLDDYFEYTDITTEATLSYLILNIHAAASVEAPNKPAARPSLDKFPVPGRRISDVIKGNLSEKLYTPKKLKEDRDNLNQTWFAVQWNNMPARGYYSTSRRTDDTRMTRDGWPTETFITFREFHRVLAGFGTIDPQMADYNFAGDYHSIFRPGELFIIHNTTIDAEGNFTSGCLTHSGSLNPNANSSWATSLIPPRSLPQNPNIDLAIPAITNCTTCGISPFLNTTLSNTTADQNYNPYLAFTRSTLWSWTPSEPSNITTQPRDKSRRCAILSTADPYPGRWYTTDCTSRRLAACQNPNQPFNWTVSREKATYTEADRKCPQDYTFAVPRTPLENAALLSALSTLNSDPVDGNDEVYININSLHTRNCWTANGGANATCPYRPRIDLNETRIVVVPVVATVIVFVLAAATVFVKCAANRREARRGGARRVLRGWEYEGVPS